MYVLTIELICVSVDRAFIEEGGQPHQECAGRRCGRWQDVFLDHLYHLHYVYNNNNKEKIIWENNRRNVIHNDDQFFFFTSPNTNISYSLFRFQS